MPSRNAKSITEARGWLPAAAAMLAIAVTMALIATAQAQAQAQAVSNSQASSAGGRTNTVTNSRTATGGGGTATASGNAAATAPPNNTNQASSASSPAGNVASTGTPAGSNTSVAGSPGSASATSPTSAAGNASATSASTGSAPAVQAAEGPRPNISKPSAAAPPRSPPPSSAAGNASLSLPPPPPAGWTRGRTTYYGGPDLLSKAYDPARGNGSFGILTYGSCGYTNSDGSLAFPPDAVAAAADADPDYPGSCGRCYQVRCVNGVVAAENNRPIRIVNGLYDNDQFRPYLPAINGSIPDTHGRSWPGNPGESQGLQYVKCWDPNQTATVRIIDSCPCTQVLQEGAPGVKAGGETRRQEWCCGGQNHFDLSYYVFERLAHPVYGVMSVDYRPVNCDTNQPLAPLPAPGYVSSVLYDGGIRPGWQWHPYSAGYFQLAQQGAGVSGGPATCVQLSPGGGLSFGCRWCGRPGYQPFAGASSLSFWIRPNSNSSDPFVSSTPTGAVPPLKVFVMADNVGGNNQRQYCFNEVNLNTTAPTATSGSWYQIVIPISDFRCQGAVAQDQLNRLDFQNVNQRDAFVCLDKVQINTGNATHKLF